MIMTPIEMPGVDASNAELAAWLRQFSEEYNMLLDRLHGVLDATEQSKSAEAQKQIRDYLEKNPAVPDTGWVKVTAFAGPFTNYDAVNQLPMYRKIGNIVYLRGAVKPTETLAPLNGNDVIEHSIFTLPKSCRPNDLCCFVCHGSGAAKWLMQVRSTGTASLSRYANENGYTNADTSTWLPFCVSFPI